MTRPADQHQQPNSARGTLRFPALALAVSGGLFLALAVGAQPADAGRRFPLLALLALSELGVILNLIAAYIAYQGARQRGFVLRSLWPLAATGLAAGGFLWAGIQLWPL